MSEINTPDTPMSALAQAQIARNIWHARQERAALPFLLTLGVLFIHAITKGTIDTPSWVDRVVLSGAAISVATHGYISFRLVRAEMADA